MLRYQGVTTILILYRLITSVKAYKTR